MQLSIVIPTYRRAAILRRVLDRLERQDAGSDAFEALVVVDAQDEDLEAVDAAIGGRPYAVRRISRHAPGVAAARNRGWREARAPLVLFLGDDILPVAELVSEHLRFHREHSEEEVGVLGLVVWSPELRKTGFMRWLEEGIQFDYGSIRGKEASPWGHFYTSNVSVKRAMLERVGGFDERFPFGYEDLDLAKRMHETAGFRLLYNARARGEHLHETTLEDWRRRMALAAPAELRFVRKHPGAEAYFRDMFAAAERAPRARGRAARFAHVVPRTFPLLGPRVWGSADVFYRQALAPAFLESWDRAEAEDPTEPSDPSRA